MTFKKPKIQAFLGVLGALGGSIIFLEIFGGN
jgi:hypothetical protein